MRQAQARIHPEAAGENSDALVRSAKEHRGSDRTLRCAPPRNADVRPEKSDQFLVICNLVDGRLKNVFRDDFCNTLRA